MPQDLFELQVSLASFKSLCQKVSDALCSNGEEVDRTKAVEIMKDRTDQIDTSEIALKYAFDAANSSIAGYDGACRAEERGRVAMARGQQAAADRTAIQQEGSTTSYA